MQNIFNTLINSFIDDKVGITEDFLSKPLALNLSNNLNSLFAAKQLQPAGIGNDELVVQNKLFRSDMIYWLDRKHNDPHENDFFDLMDEFVSHLNSTCCTGYKFHYALYEKGSFYKKHLDQFKNNDSRQYSLIMYLNENWQEADGGELCIHHDGGQQKIALMNGKCVFFKSNELAHEVLMANKSRRSITGWLKKD